MRARVMANGELMATRDRRRASCAHRASTSQWRCAHDAARRRAPRRHRARQLAVRHLRLRAGRGAAAAARAGDAGRDHAGLHRQRRERRHRAARPRRLGHLGAYFAAKLQRDAPRDLDRRARHVQRQPALDADRARCCALHYDEAQEIASTGAKVLHPRCILPVRQYAIPLYVYATQAPELEGTLIDRRPVGDVGAGQGRLRQEGHHAGVDGKPGHVARGRLPRRCLPGLQGPWPVGRPGLHLGDQRHRVARPAGQHAGCRHRSTRAASRLSAAVPRRRSSGPAPR